MDVLTSAASAHEVASKSDADSPRGSPAQYEAQILALKRKLIECDRGLNSAHERISGLEKALDIEKREHQLTTSKLTMLLKKRGASGAQSDQRRVGAPDMTGFETSPAWMASVRAASFGHASAPAPCAEPSSGPEIPSHAQPRVCVRKATQENGTAKRPAGSQGASDKAADPATTDERTAHAPDGAADHAPADDSAG